MKVYIPMVMNSYKHKPFLSTYLERVDEKRVGYAHPKARIHNGITWHDDFDYGELDRRMALLEGHDYSIQIKNSPEWARVYPEFQCSPIKGDYWLTFAQFIVSVVQRFKPYAVEIWNEPEVRTDQIVGDADKIFGCFGGDDMYNAGAGYGRFVGAIYEYVKSKVDVEIWSGALMAGSSEHLKFAHGLADYGLQDAISYHGYVGYTQHITGTIDKAKMIREFYQGPLVLSETAYQWDGLDDLQAEWAVDYLRYTYQHLEENNIKGMNWYTLADNGWRNTDLVYKDHKRPVYYEYWRLCDEI